MANDVYLSDVLEVRGRNEYIPTIDFATNGQCWSGTRTKDKKQAEKELKEAEQKFDVKLVPDPRMISPALTKTERDWVSECKKQNKKYKDVLLKSRIERRKLTKKEMDVNKLEDKIKEKEDEDKEVELKEMK